MIPADAQDVFQHNEAFATSVLQDQVQLGDFGRLMGANGIEAAVVLDDSGRVLAPHPMSATILGSGLGPKYAHLRGGELAAVEVLFAGLCTGFDYCARPVRRLASGELAPG